MKESDSFSLSSNSWHFVDEPDSGLSASLESSVQIIDSKAHVMNPGAASRDEFSYRSVVGSGFQKLNERVARLHGGDARPVRIIDLNFREAEDVCEEWETRRD